MLKLLRNRFIKFILVGGIFWTFSSLASAAGPIAEIIVSLDPGPYTAGTAAPGGDVSIICRAYDDSAPTAGQTVTFRMLDPDTGLPLTGALNDENFVTDGTNALYTSGGLLGNVIFYRANDTSYLQVGAGTITVQNATPFDVNADVAAKLVVLGPSMSYRRGINQLLPVITGGTNPRPADPFDVSVRVTDAYFNPVTAGAYDIALSANPSYASIPDNTETSGSGIATFTGITIAAPNTPVPFTATSGGWTSETIITSGGPSTEEVFMYPSPFNPKLGQSITFKFLTDDAKDFELKVTDQFGGRVWEGGGTSSAGTYTSRTWDGRNSQGTIVASGVYNVLLEVGGELKSKKRFGVSK